jgi:hypothetical protein
VGSKKGLTPPPADTSKALRPMMGEKGIGRLAIGSIGSQVLVLTRAKRDGQLHDLVVAYLHWGLFGLPGLDLDEVIIPLKTFPGGTLPNSKDVSNMVEEVITNISNLESIGKIDSEDADKLIGDVNQFNVDPTDINSYLTTPNCDQKPLSLSGDGHGTHFIIYPADDILQVAIDGDHNSNEASPLLKMLLGFTNTMTPDTPKPVIHTSFRDHISDKKCIDLIGEKEFFTPDEFEVADHHIKGEFDENGQFKGTINIYGNKEINHIVPWTRPGGSGKTSCGPFKINIAYVQGRASQSKLSLEDFSHLYKKSEHFGGLYIYKNGIRVLPYGDSNYDFLNIERNRNKSASYYYFSYRRMFGSIEITKEMNSKLIEKAGREGFRENKAYRQFRSILQNLFIQLAADFFREASSSPKTKYFLDQRAEITKLYKAKQDHEKKANAKKNKFTLELDDFFTKLHDGCPQKEIVNLLSSIPKEFESISSIKDVDESVIAFLNIESKARRELSIIRDTYKVTKPRSIALGKKIRHDFDAYLNEYENLENNVLLSAEKQIEEIANGAAEDRKFLINKRNRLEKALNDTFEEVKSSTTAEIRETKSKLISLNNNVSNLIQDILIEIDDEVNKSKSKLESLNISNVDDADLVTEKLKLESELVSKTKKDKEILNSIRAQLDDINCQKIDGYRITSLDIRESIEEELQTFREQADVDLEITQLGTAIAIIHHEFAITIQSIRNGITDLKAWADVNENLDPIYKSIRVNFEHLDGYLTLFTPLNRRLYRKEIDIQGNTIKQYLEDIFSVRMLRHGISIKYTALLTKHSYLFISVLHQKKNRVLQHFKTLSITL